MEDGEGKLDQAKERRVSRGHGGIYYLLLFICVRRSYTFPSPVSSTLTSPPLPTAQSRSRPRDPAPLDHIWILVLHSLQIPTLHLDEDPLRMQANAVQCASNLGRCSDAQMLSDVVQFR